MNYLAHAYLSFEKTPLLIGNLISDFVKGRKKFDYPAPIQVGIGLHRSIDAFTDQHPCTKAAAAFFRPHYRLYSGPFTDVVFDHFLANDPGEFTEESLFIFSRKTYKTLEENAQWLPDNFLRVFHYMRAQNWLSSYRTVIGIEKSFAGLVHRSNFLQESETANAIFETHYLALGQIYREFWKDLKQFAQQQIDSFSV